MVLDIIAALMTLSLSWEWQGRAGMTTPCGRPRRSRRASAFSKAWSAPWRAAWPSCPSRPWQESRSLARTALCTARPSGNCWPAWSPHADRAPAPSTRPRPLTRRTRRPGSAGLPGLGRWTTRRGPPMPALGRSFRHDLELPLKHQLFAEALAPVTASLRAGPHVPAPHRSGAGQPPHPPRLQGRPRSLGRGGRRHRGLAHPQPAPVRRGPPAWIAWTPYCPSDCTCLAKGVVT
jgi:hypothetical protein